MKSRTKLGAVMAVLVMTLVGCADTDPGTTVPGGDTTSTTGLDLTTTTVLDTTTTTAAN
ncbi:MAG TPA: hypothetical protein VJR05_14105 [Acidimicrobiia bacterium]|nr:hypothetical protein [Acidimicrobiia bacterium]